MLLGKSSIGHAADLLQQRRQFKADHDCETYPNIGLFVSQGASVFAPLITSEPAQSECKLTIDDCAYPESPTRSKVKLSNPSHLIGYLFTSRFGTDFSQVNAATGKFLTTGGLLWAVPQSGSTSSSDGARGAKGPRDTPRDTPGTLRARRARETPVAGQGLCNLCNQKPGAVTDNSTTKTGPVWEQRSRKRNKWPHKGNRSPVTGTGPPVNYTKPF